MVAIGGILAALSALDALREILESAGVDGPKAARIIREFVRKVTGSAPAEEDDKEGQPAAAVEEPLRWEYAALTLTRPRSWTGPKPLLPRLLNGAEIAGVDATELAAYLNRLADEGWSLVSAIEDGKAPTLLLRRPKASSPKGA